MNMCFRSRPRRLALVRDARGQSMVETAIVLPMLLFVTFAIIDFGVLFAVNLSLESGVSQAARQGVTGASAPGMNREETIKAAMRRTTPILTITDDAFQFSHLVGGNWVAGVGGPGDIQRLTVTYTHELLILKPLFPNGRVDLRAESTMKNEARFE
jgi:Flp pilus assembly protein TadG